MIEESIAGMVVGLMMLFFGGTMLAKQDHPIAFKAGAVLAISGLVMAIVSTPRSFWETLVG